MLYWNLAISSGFIAPYKKSDIQTIKATQTFPFSLSCQDYFYSSAVLIWSAIMKIYASLILYVDWVDFDSYVQVLWSCNFDMLFVVFTILLLRGNQNCQRKMGLCCNTCQYTIITSVHSSNGLENLIWYSRWEITPAYYAKYSKFSNLNVKHAREYWSRVLHH